MKFKSDIEVQAGLRDSSGSTGASGQILSSNGNTVSWVPAGSSVASDVQNEVKAGVAINKGQAVYVTSADGTNIIVGLASNTTEATSSKTLGLLNATVAINGFADVVQIGRLAGLNTLAATVGDPVWLGSNGNLIYGLINKPYAPLHLVFIGIVTRVNANNGEIFVNVQNGFELNEIHDVDLKTNVPINGDILGYNGTLWVNKTIAVWLGYTPANQAITIATTAPLSGGGDLSANRTLSISQAGAASNGYLSANDWGIFNGKQNALNGTGFVKASGTTISYDNSTYTPTSRTITINGVTQDLSANQTWTIASGVTSFNTRTGAITLTSGDVTTALGYTPVTNARTITINGVAQDLSANRSWTVTAVETDTLQTVTSRGNTTTTSITANSVIIPSFETATNVLSFRSGIPDGTNVGIRAKAIVTANRDGLELLGYNGIDFSTNNGATLAMRLSTSGNLTTTPGGTSGAYYLSDTNAGLYRDNSYDVVLTQNNSSGNVLYMAGAGDVRVSIDSNDNDTGNRFIVGNNAVKASNELFSVNESGTAFASNDFRAPIFYDSNNTGYYLDPSSTSNIVAMQVNGTLNVAASNAQFWTTTGGGYQRVDARDDSTGARMHWYGVLNNGATSNFRHAWYDGTAYFGITADSAFINFTRSGGGNITTDGSFRAPVFYDSNDTNYYVNPGDASRIRKTDIVAIGAGWLDALNIYSSDATNKWSLLPDAGASNSLRFAYNTSEKFRVQTNGSVISLVEHQSPIYYDFNNTAYYLNPDGTSNTNLFTVNQLLFPSTRFVPATGPRNTEPMSVKMWNNYFDGTGLGSDYGTVLEYYSMSGHVASQVYFDAAGGSWYRSASYNSGWQGWQRYVTDSNVGSFAIPISGGTTTGNRPLTFDTSGGGIYIKGSGGGWATGYYFYGTSGTYRGGFGALGGNDSLSNYWIGPAYDNYYTYIDSAQMSHSSSMRTPIFYDLNNTGYYVDPASTSSLNVLSMANKIIVGSFPNSTVNNGEAWLGRAGDRLAGTMTVQLGGNLDRKFEVVDYSWSVVNFFVNGYGVAEASGSMRAPIFYDSNNTGYYVDPASTSNFNAANFAGSVNLFGGYGPGSGPGLGFENQNSFIRLAFWGMDFYDWNHGIQMVIDNGYVSANNSFRAPIFYDSNNTGYYLDPNGTSRINTINADTLISYGVSYASATGGFASSTYAVGVRNPIWRFGNADGYGLSYFQGTAGDASQDTIGFHFGTATSAGSQFKMRGDGVFFASNDIIAFSSSDRQLKDNITPIENALEKLKQIGGYTFDWNDKQEVHSGHDVGVIAQEVELVLPEVVTTRDTGYKAVKYEKIVPLLIEAIKEQQRQIEELKQLIKNK